MATDHTTRPRQVAAASPSPPRVRTGMRHRAGVVARTIGVRAIPLALFLLLWDLGANQTDAIDIPGVAETFDALVQVLGTSELWTALAESNKAMALGYVGAVAVGLPLGVLMGRVRPVNAVVDGYLSILLIAPMAMVVPLIIMALGFGTNARALVVFMFVLPMIVVNARVGVRTVPTDLIEMGTSFCATEVQLWRRVILPAAAPAVFAGLRIGIGRAITGMVISEWLLAAVGVGALLLRFRGQFQPDALFAVIIVVLIESLILVQLIRLVERRVVGWATP